MHRSTNAEVRQTRAASPSVTRPCRMLRWGAAMVLAAFVVAEAPLALASPPFKAPPKRRVHRRVQTAPAARQREAPPESAAKATPPPQDTTPPASATTDEKPASDAAAAPARIERVRYQADDHNARVIVMLSRSVPYEVTVLPGERTRGSERRVVLDFSNAKLGAEATRPIGVEDGVLKQIRTGQFTARTARVVLDMASVTGHHVSALDDPPRVVVDIAGRVPKTTSATPPPESRGAESTRAAATRGGPETRDASGTAAPDHSHAEPAAGAPAAVREPGRSAAPDAATPPPSAPEAKPTESGARAPRRLPDKPGATLAGSVAGRAARERDSVGARDERTAMDRAADRAQPDDATERERGAAVGESATDRVQPERRARSDGRPQADAKTEIAHAERPASEADTARHDESEVATRTEAVPTARPPAATTRATPWRVVLDPGHGGNDPGTLGVDGVYEKNVTLAIAKRLKRRLEQGLGAQVLLTRDRDQTRSLAERTAFANASNADVFVSIHANADAAGELHGVETYTLNNTNDRAAIRLAKMENGPGMHAGHDDDLSFILSDMVQSGKEEDSIALANRLQQHLLYRLRTHYPDVRNLGVKKGPFYVLVGAYMPCVLVETSFLSHPVEGRRLASPAYQADVVEGLYLGLADYLGDARLAKTL